VLRFRSVSIFWLVLMPAIFGSAGDRSIDVWVSSPAYGLLVIAYVVTRSFRSAHCLLVPRQCSLPSLFLWCMWAPVGSFDVLPLLVLLNVLMGCLRLLITWLRAICLCNVGLNGRTPCSTTGLRLPRYISWRDVYGLLLALASGFIGRNRWVLRS